MHLPSRDDRLAWESATKQNILMSPAILPCVFLNELDKLRVHTCLSDCRGTIWSDSTQIDLDRGNMPRWKRWFERCRKRQTRIYWMKSARELKSQLSRRVPSTQLLRFEEKCVKRPRQVITWCHICWIVYKTKILNFCRHQCAIQTTECIMQLNLSYPHK